MTLLVCAVQLFSVLSVCAQIKHCEIRIEERGEVEMRKHLKEIKSEISSFKDAKDDGGCMGGRTRTYIIELIPN